MRYRSFGSLGWETSVLGLGVMCLPGRVAGRGEIDTPAAISLIRQAIDQGVNYLDLGYPGDLAEHQPILASVRSALADGYRSRVKMALTVPAALIASAADFQRCLETQLSWVGTDSVDICLLGRLTRDNWPLIRDLGVLECLEQAQASGLVGQVGFSFHDHYQVLRTILHEYDRWTVASFQFSFMDINHDPGINGLRLAAQQGLAVVVTEPLKRGQLTREAPETVSRAWRQSGRDWTPAEWALRFVWNHPEICTAVVDITTQDQLEEDLRVADEAAPGGLTITDEVVIGAVRDAYRNRQAVPCPSCRPCMPCPLGIDVPRFFEIYNDAALYGDVATARWVLEQEHIHPELCNACGLCEERCAKRLSIIEWLERGRALLGV